MTEIKFSLILSHISQMLLFLFYIFTLLAVLHSMWDLVPCPGIKPGPPALGEQTHSYRATWEVSTFVLLTSVCDIAWHRGAAQHGLCN